MRESIDRHFDVVVVVWVLALVFCFSLVSLSKSTQLSQDQWISAPQSGPVWDHPTDTAAR